MDRIDDHAGKLRFGVFEVDLRAGELTKRGRRVPLQAQPFQFLAILLEKPGEIVTREALSARLWDRTIVDFDHGINKSVNKVREALGDSADSPRFVETVARRGYRFIADVTRIDDDATNAEPTSHVDTLAAGSSATPSVTPAVTRSITPLVMPAQAPPIEPASIHALGPVPRTARRRALLLALAVVLVGVVGWLATERVRHGIGSSPVVRSLAVLPLKNLSGDPSQDYFADGMTDGLISDLGQIGALRVISRTSAMTYKQRDVPPAQIANELGVDALVQGTVLRSGNRVQITARLLRVPDESLVWEQTYDVELRDMPALQNSITSAIVEHVKVDLNPDEAAALRRSKAVNPDAFEAYLKGRFFWNKRTREGFQRAIGFFGDAVDTDPNFAGAYSGLADSYALLADWENGNLAPQEAFPMARVAATRALELDDHLSEAHTSLAFIEDLYDWTWVSAENEYRRALALNPGYATAHHWYAWHLMVMRRDAEGLAEMRKAASLDPLSLIISADLADALSIAHSTDESMQQSRKTIEMDPNFAVAHFLLGQALEQKAMHAEAIAEFRRAIELTGGNTTFESNLANAYAVSGQKAQALRMVKGLESRTGQDSPADASIALVYVGLGDNDRAMTWLEKARRARFNPSILLRPGFDPLRGDARFQALVQAIGLPADPVGSSPH
jgi:TolB-like protein/DNA-binding winged helix-turn-helix (wHTH) protein/tetratricopeptide (TPR) repeat protein